MSDREICLNCKQWSENYRASFDAGAMALCEKFSFGQHIHPSVEGVMVFAEEHNPEDNISMMPISTRWNFGCNQFVRK